MEYLYFKVQKIPFGLFIKQVMNCTSNGVCNLKKLFYMDFGFGNQSHLWVDLQKPLIHTLSDLETNGTDFTINGQIYNNKSYLICGTADLPAMSLVMNCIELIVDHTATLRCQICHFSHILVTWNLAHFMLMLISAGKETTRVQKKKLEHFPQFAVVLQKSIEALDNKDS